MKKKILLMLCCLFVIIGTTNAFAVIDIKSELLENMYMENETFVISMFEANEPDAAKFEKKLYSIINEKDFDGNISNVDVVRKNQNYIVSLNFRNKNRDKAFIIYADDDAKYTTITEIVSRKREEKVILNVPDATYNDGQFSILKHDISDSYRLLTYKMTLNAKSTDVRVVSAEYEFREDKNMALAVQKEVVKIYPQIFKDKNTIAEKVQAVNEYIADNHSYRYDGEAICYTAYGLITNGYGVCQGYASLAFELLKAANVPVRFIYNEEHGWLLVKHEDGKWYHFDPTYNDPLLKDRGIALTTYNKMTDEKLLKERIWNEAMFNETANNKAYESFLSEEIVVQNKKSYVEWNKISLKDNRLNDKFAVIGNDSAFVPIEFLQAYLTEAYEKNLDIWTFYKNGRRIILNLKNKTFTFDGKTYRILKLYDSYYVSLKQIASALDYKITITDYTAILER